MIIYILVNEYEQMFVLDTKKKMQEFVEASRDSSLSLYKVNTCVSPAAQFVKYVKETPPALKGVVWDVETIALEGKGLTSRVWRQLVC